MRKSTPWAATAALLLGLAGSPPLGQAWAQASLPTQQVSATPLADAQRHKDLAVQIVKLTLDDGNFEGVMTQSVNIGFVAVGEELKRKRGLSEAELQPYRDAFRRAFLGTYPRSDWEDELASVYVQLFSTDELSELLRWYQTPTGRKLLQRMPDVLQGGAQAGQRVVQRRLPVFQRAVAREMKAIEAD